jgi:3-hydroxyisobutyrate dehydrogenase and related beta-hydroxyacid dehydrogenases
MKMVFNHQLGHAMAAFAEGVQLGSAMGLDEQQVMRMLLGGPVTAPFLQGKQEKIEQGDYSPDFPLKWMQKDLHLASKAAYESNASGLMTSTVKELYQFARQQGWADQDFSAIYAYLRSLHKGDNE